MKYNLVLLLILLLHPSCYAQRKLNDLPDIPGYKTLTGDFHVHTVFSDGEVTPEFRIDEAVREGIDVIALTDHIEYRPHKHYLNADHNTNYDVGLPYANERNVLLIRGVEVTREMPTGHFNVLFLQDVNKLDQPDFMKVMEEANRQGGFVFWNHPGWKKQQPDGIPKFHDVHNELYRRGWLHGIEFYNTKCAYNFVLDWCAEKKLTVFSNSDVHIAASDFWEFGKGGKRPLTLVFAKDKTEADVKEALKAGRTLALFSGDSLGGRADLAEQFFRAAVQVSKPYHSDKDYVHIEIVNSSSLPFYLTNTDAAQEPKTLKLEPKSATRVKLKRASPAEQTFTVGNIVIGDGKFLQTRLRLMQ